MCIDFEDFLEYLYFIGELDDKEGEKEGKPKTKTKTIDTL